ncbi:conserved hypothetical protein [Crenothrix polyspora]|uniref:Uncharacterized protein n=1 Tax=Crenothrix polyspora TaxID=360316 RepID=A0A1R4HF51_9GAMM|nr:hypothetical protein [Crenothrix polyspora]SJM94827.1 conserved hypothetical protein [Crenothrix polyspora]
MIDRPKQVVALMEKMKAHLPIPAKPTDVLINSSVNISPSAEIEITDVMYLGDEGGICCALTISGQEENAVVVSLTHLRIQSNNPLSSDIRAYQALRIKKLARKH